MADVENQIGFEQLGLGSVLQRYQLMVPPNQREYSWDADQVTTLLQDFAKAINDAEKAYFLGTVVTIPHAGGELEVVDGQQRLATTSILLAAIKDYLKSTDSLISQSVENDFLTVIDRSARERIPRVKLNSDDNDFYKSVITDYSKSQFPTKSSHEKIKKAYELALDQVKKIVSTIDIKDHGDILNTWVNFLQYNALVVLLRVPSEVNAYKMFETLNDRGLKTSQSDLVKNYLFGKGGSRLNEVQQKWSYMKGTLESIENDDTTVDFLRHAVTARYGFVREAKVFEKVQEIAKSPQTAVTFIANMETAATLYVAIQNPEHEKWNTYSQSVRESINVLNLFNVRQMRPLMLAIAANFDNKETSSAFAFLVSLAIRLIIASNTTSGSVEQSLANAALKIYSKEITKSVDLKKALKSITPIDEVFKRAFEVATVSNNRIARYYLRSLEMAKNSEKEPWLIPNDDGQIINLEHILPTKPEGNWPQFSDDDVKANVKRIGNMVLLQATKNSDLKSAPFNDKKIIYGASPYLLTKEISTKKQWTKEEISERQSLLADLALKAWPI